MKLESKPQLLSDPFWQKAKVVRDIELTFVYPPIPERNYDWQATRKGWEPGELYGQGRTPVLALADLLEQEEEANG